MKYTLHIRALSSLRYQFVLNKSILGNYSGYHDLNCFNEYPLLSKTATKNNIVLKSVIHNPTLTQIYRFQSTNIRKDDNDKSTPVTSEKVVISEPLSKKDKLKKAVKEYGSTVIVFHVAISLMSLGTSYLVVSSGLDVTSLFETIGLQNLTANSSVATSAGTFAVAYALHKVFAPVRITITLASVPFIVRYFRKTGILKK